jgi:5-methylcytosine-specific restriction endonuclease McrA
VLHTYELIFCGDRPPQAPPTTDSQCQRDGIRRLGEDLDHIVPMDGPDDPRRLDASNTQWLCTRCHAAKTRRDQRR